MMNSVLENFTILLVTVLSLSCFVRLSHEAAREEGPGWVWVPGGQSAAEFMHP